MTKYLPQKAREYNKNPKWKLVIFITLLRKKFT